MFKWFKGCLFNIVVFIAAVAVLIGALTAAFMVMTRPDSPLMAIFDRRLYALTMYQKRQDAMLGIEQAPANAERWQQFLEFAYFFALLVIALCLFALARRVWIWANKPASVIQASNGLFPVMLRDVAPWWQRIFGRNNLVTVNPNMPLAPVQSYSFKPGGTIEAFNPPIHEDPEIVRLALASQAQAQAQQMALSTGGRVNVRQTFNNGGGIGGRKPAAYVTPAPVASPPPKPRVLMTPAEAVNKAEGGQVYLGVTHTPRQGLGDYAVWDSNEASQIGVFGANGTGKTRSIATMVVLVAIRWFWHVLVLDPKRGADWRRFEPYIERHDSGPEEMPVQLQRVCDEIDRRSALCAQYSVGTIQDLPYEVRPQVMLLVIEELGDTRAQLAPLRKGKLLERFDAQLSKIMRVSRYVGIKVLLIDQRPENWPPAAKSNLKAIITFKQGMHQGNAVGYYGAHLLANKGQFAYEGVVYDAFHAYPVIDQFLEAATKHHRKQAASGCFLTWQGHQIPKLLTGPVSIDDMNLETPVPLALPEAPVSSVAEDDVLPEMQTRDAYDDEQGRISAFFEANPDATQADLRRVFNFSNNKAFRLWHKYGKKEA